MRQGQVFSSIQTVGYLHDYHAAETQRRLRNQIYENVEESIQRPEIEDSLNDRIIRIFANLITSGDVNCSMQVSSQIFTSRMSEGCYLEFIKSDRFIVEKIQKS